MREALLADMNQQFLQNLTQFGEILLDEKDFGIVIGAHQNLDTVAASLALYLSLSQAGKNVQIVSIKEPLVEVSSLVGVNKIGKSFKGDTTKLVVALPYIKGEVEKVLFTEQQDTINFHLTAAPGRTITPFELDQVKLNWEGGAPKNIITVGVGNLNELGGILDQSAKIINIDNYQGNSRFGELVLVEESLSSLSEIIGKIIKDQRLPFDSDIAQNILDGILFATRNFTKGNTSPVAFEIASNAMYQGAQRKDDVRQGQSSVLNQPIQNRQRSDQGFSTTPNRQFQDRQSRAQGKQGKPFDQAPFDRADKQGKQARVNENDFPAMHMQDIRNQIRGSANQPRHSQNLRQSNMTVPTQNRNMNPMPSAQFDQNMPFEGNEVINDDQSQPRQDFNAPVQQPFDSTQGKSFDDTSFGSVPFDAAQGKQDRQGKPFDSAQGKQNMQPNPMPEPENYDNVSDDDVPEDWLMPKVFKSSKNNN